MVIKRTANYTELVKPETPKTRPTRQEVESMVSYIMHPYKSVIWRGYGGFNYDDIIINYIEFKYDEDKNVQKDNMSVHFRAGNMDTKLEKGIKVSSPNWKSWYDELWEIFFPIRKLFDERNPEIDIPINV